VIAVTNLEAVELRRIVTGRDDDAAFRFQVAHRKIEHRGGAHAHIQDLAAAGHQSLHQPVSPFRGTFPAVPAHYYPAFALPTIIRAQSPPQTENALAVQIKDHPGTDIVLPMN